MGSGINSGFYWKASPHKILGFDFTGASINSTNRMFSIQAGKTLNFPTFLSFLGDVGIYGGVGIEFSDLTIDYELDNPFAYGCFLAAHISKKHLKMIVQVQNHGKPVSSLIFHLVSPEIIHSGV